MACLVQQLFRQKIGQGLDQGIVDDVLFPMLRSMKHGPKELLQDIKMTLVEVGYCVSPITKIAPTDRPDLGLVAGDPINIPPLTCMPILVWSNNPSMFRKIHEGRCTSKFRRESVNPRDWGTIDILNKLRELKRPLIRYHECWNRDDWYRSNMQTEFDDVFIHVIDEHCDAIAREHYARSTTTNDTKLLEAKSATNLVNAFLKKSLENDTRLTWGGNGEFQPILSNYY